MTQIEAAAALSAGSGSFYRHFRSEEEVLQAVVDREVDRINAERQIGPEPEETGGDVRVALALEFKRRLDNLRRLHPLRSSSHASATISEHRSTISANSWSPATSVSVRNA